MPHYLESIRILLDEPLDAGALQIFEDVGGLEIEPFPGRASAISGNVAIGIFGMKPLFGLTGIGRIDPAYDLERT